VKPERIAALLGVSPWWVHNTLNNISNLGTKNANTPHEPEGNDEVAAALREQEWTLERIATLLGVTQPAVTHWLADVSIISANNANLPSEPESNGEAEPEPFDARRKVSANEKQAIWEEVRKQRKLHRVVAAEHGISRGRVSQIVKAIDERKARDEEEAEADSRRFRGESGGA